MGRFEVQNIDLTQVANDAAAAGRYAALVLSSRDFHYDPSDSIVQVFDLKAGTEVSPRLGNETVVCDDFDLYNCASGMDDLVLNPQGFTAVHTTRTLLEDCSPYPCEYYDQTEQIVAHDSTGLHVLDTAGSQYSTSQHGRSLLGDLALSGDTLTWNNAGTDKSFQLH